MTIHCPSRFVLNRDQNTRAFFVELSGAAKLPSYLERFERKTKMLFMRPELGVKAFEVSQLY